MYTLNLSLLLICSVANALCLQPTIDQSTDRSTQSLFHQWTYIYRKEYNSIAEWQARLIVFQDNLNSVVAQNQLYVTGQSNWQATINTPFADLTKSEFLKQRTGYNRALSQTRISQLNQTFGALPAEVNWVKQGAVTEVKDQGQCGSCYIFSAVGAIESAAFLKTGKLTSLSEQSVLTCDLVDSHCGGGDMANVFDYVIKTGGLESETDYPYLAKAEKQCHLIQSKIVPWSKITGQVALPANSRSAFLNALATQPLSIGIDAGPLQFYDSGIIDADSCGTDLDHGVLAVGFKQNVSQPYILVKNSWGSYFGENGYFRLQLLETEETEGTCGAYMDASYPVV